MKKAALTVHPSACTIAASSPYASPSAWACSSSIFHAQPGPPPRPSPSSAPPTALSSATLSCQLYIRDLSTPHALTIYASNVKFNPQISQANGWLGYERMSSGIVQVWRHYLNGQEEQVSTFPESSRLVVTGPNGEIVFSHGSDMWISVLGAAPVPGAPYRFMNGKAYFVAGGSLFLENDPTGSGSSTSAAAGGTSTSGAGSAGSAGATSTSSAGSVGANGEVGTSTSAGSTGAGDANGGGSSGGCSVRGEQGASAGLEGLGLLGLAALLARRRERRGGGP